MWGSSKDTMIFTGEKMAILNEEFTKRLSRFAMRVREDTDAFMVFNIISLTVITGLLLYWWEMGKAAMFMYAQNWLARYPTVPMNESWILNATLIIDGLTKFILIVVWTFTFVFVACFAYSEREAKKQVGIGGRPMKPKQCPNCKSEKTRPATGEKTGMIYCKSCKRYY